MRAIFVSALLSLVSLTFSAQAGTIIVSGDANLLDSTDTSQTTFNPNNLRLFENALGAGSNVLIAQENLRSASPLNDHFNTLSGVSSTYDISGNPITSASLSGIDLLIQVGAVGAFLSSERLAIARFLNAGGTLFSIGDYNNAGGFVNNSFQNALLGGLGSSIRIEGTLLDVATQVTTNIASDPLTAGISNFTYAGPGLVTGGTTLIETKNDPVFSFGTFVAYEAGITAPVPLPAGFVMLIGGLSAFGLLRKRVRS